MSLSELVSRYLAERAPAWSPSTLLSARRNLAMLTSFLETSGRPTLHRDDVIAFVLHVRERRTPQGRPWSLSMQVGVLGSVRRFLGWCTASGHVLGDLAKWVEVPRRHTLPRALGEQAVERLLDGGARSGGRTELRDRAILELLYGTGLRAQELLRLELHDVAFAEATLHVRHGKGRKDRIVPLTDGAERALRAYLAHERPVRSSTRLFLPSRGATELSYAALKLMLRCASTRAGIDSPASPHVLRHSYATHLLRRGASLPAIKLLLGHRSIQSTEVYTDVVIPDLHRMIARCHPRGGERGRPRRRRGVK